MKSMSDNGHRFSWFSYKYGTKTVIVLAGYRAPRWQFHSFIFIPYGPFDIQFQIGSLVLRVHCIVKVKKSLYRSEQAPRIPRR